MPMPAHPVYGREAELRDLGAALERAIAGDPRALFYAGAPGIGKSALLEEFRRRAVARHPGLRVHFVAPDAAAAYTPIAAAAQLATRVPGLGHLHEHRVVTTARELLPDWLAAIPVVGDLVAAIVATAEALHRRRSGRDMPPSGTADEAVETLRRAARKRVLVLLFDGLERADRSALAPVEALLHAVTSERLLVAGTYRPAAPGAPVQPVERLLESLPAERCACGRLRALSTGAVGAWLAACFPGAALPGDFQAWFLAATGGHPATIAATLDRVRERETIRPQHHGWTYATESAALDLPSSAPAVADLSALDTATADVIVAASQLGERFDAFSLARLLERDELAVEDRLALGIHYGVLAAVGERDLPDGNITTVYRFVDPHLPAALRGVRPPPGRALEP